MSVMRFGGFFPLSLPQSIISSRQITRTLIHLPVRGVFVPSASLPNQILPSHSLESRSVPFNSLLVGSLPQNFRAIIALFQNAHNPRAKYEQLLYYGRNLPPLQIQHKTPENKVQGCVSQVWVRAYLDANRNVQFEADSDSVLTKGLAALLVQGLSGQPPLEIAKLSPDFVEFIGLQQSLTPSRNNGFLSMLKMMQKKALQLHSEANGSDDIGKDDVAEVKNLLLWESTVDLSENTPSGDILRSRGQDDEEFIYSVESAVEELNAKGDSNSDSENTSGSRLLRIRETLGRELRPLELEVENISNQHAGHAAVRGNPSGETHFSVRIVSEVFAGKSLLKRHRLVYDLLQQELQNGLHALSISAKAPGEAGGN